MLRDLLHADTHVSALFYIGLLVLALLAFIPIAKMFLAAGAKTHAHLQDPDKNPQPAIWDWLKPVLVVVLLLTAVFLALLGTNKTMENYKAHNAEYSAPLPAFTEAAKAEKAALKPQSKAELSVERVEEATKAETKESKAIDRKAADEAGKLMDFRTGFPALQDPALQAPKTPDPVLNTTKGDSDL